MEFDKDLPFETLLKLEQQLGSKTFREVQAAGATKPIIKKRKQKTDSDDDEAPEEFSSKHPPKRSFAKGPRVKEAPSIDPRFNARAGEYKEKHFKKNFQFAFELKNNELVKLKESTVNSENPEEVKKAKYLVQRMENQKRAEQQKKKQLKPTISKNGSKYFPSKKEVLAKELVDRFEELKESGKLSSHLEKRRKTLAGKERKRMNIEKT